MNNKLEKFNSIIEAIQFHADTSPDSDFCLDLTLDRAFSYLEFNHYINKCANYIESLDDHKIKIISSAMRNSIEGLIIFFASQKVGAAINPMPNSLSSREIQRNLEFVKPDLTFLEAEQKSNHFEGKQKILYIDMDQRGFLDELDKFPNHYEDFPKPEDISALYYTSGTTSDPKCMEYSHKSQIHLIESISRAFRFTKKNIHLGILPIGHTAITNYQLLPCLLNGSKLILVENYMSVRQNFWEIISEEAVSYVQVVPTILIMVFNTPTDFLDFDQLKLDYIGCGSAPLGIEIQLQFQEKFGIPVANLYGLSESGPSHFDDPLQSNWEPGGIGKPLDVNDCKIFRDDMTIADSFEIGQIALKGENIFNGYYNNQEATIKAMHNGYFLTGDLGYYNNDGYFFFSDRSKDLIIKGGVNIFPGEIEEIISSLTEIEIAAVVGIPHKILGEDIVAFVKLKDGKNIDKQSIIQKCRDNLQPMKVPSIIEFVDEVPTTPSGKIIKRSLLQNG